MTAPKVVYVGNNVVPWCTEVHMARSLQEAGAEVTFVRQDDAHREGPAEFVSLVAGLGADLTLYTRTHNATALGPEWSQAWRELRRRGIVTASFHLDRFWDLERERLVTDDPRDALFTTAHVFTADGNDRRWRTVNVNHHWLPPAVDRIEAEMPGRVNRRMQHDVVFVGSGDYHQAYPERDELLAFLHDRYGSRFAHYGHGGGRTVVRGQALNDLYASAKIVVGDSCFANHPDRDLSQNYWSDRVPETLGRGGALVHPYVEGLGDGEPYGLDDGNEIRFHIPGDFDDLAARVDALLEWPDGITQLRKCGREAVLASHTYTHRASELLAAVGLAPDRARVA